MNKKLVYLVSALFSAVLSAFAQDKVVVAMVPFSIADGLTSQQLSVSEIVVAELSSSKKIVLVDRDQLQKTLAEVALGQSGMVSPDSAKRLGSILGARYFCSGNLSKSGDKVMVIAKTIDVESTLMKTAYSFVSAQDNTIEAGKAMADKIEGMVADFEADRLNREKQTVAQVAKSGVKPIPRSWKRPVVMVIVPEMQANHPPLIDPAAETELIKRLIADDFTVIDSDYVSIMKENALRAKSLFGTLKTATRYAAEKKVDVLLYGEAISERGVTLGDFKGCRGRVELKAVDVRSDKILLADSAEGGATDLADSVAGKKAIQQAANRLADQFLYAFVEKWNMAK